MKGGRFAFACFLCVTLKLKKKKDLQFTYLIIYDIFTFKVWFENNLHRSIMKVLYCANGFCKEMNEQRMKTFLSEQHATNRNKDSND